MCYGIRSQFILWDGLANSVKSEVTFFYCYFSFFFYSGEKSSMNEVHYLVREYGRSKNILFWVAFLEMWAFSSVYFWSLNLGKVITTNFRIRHLNAEYTKAVVRMCFTKKVFLNISQNTQENTCARVYFLIKFFFMEYAEAYSEPSQKLHLRCLAGFWIRLWYLIRYHGTSIYSWYW